MPFAFPRRASESETGDPAEVGGLPEIEHHRLSVAPMMRRTDRHCRYFHRQISKHVLLYTEMVTAGTLLEGDRTHVLRFHEEEHPVVLQLGGDDPDELRACAVLAEEAGYDEINLNVGCPSPRVRRGAFGACLMKEPETVARAVAAIREAIRIPVTVKHRIGVDELDSYQALRRFVEIVASAGCETFIVHARKAWLQGLSPKENREVPPLRYPDVHRLKTELPHLRIEINGGFDSLSAVREQLRIADGVMVGRAAYTRPHLLAAADREIFQDPRAGVPSRREIVERMIPYVEREVASGEPLYRITRHMLGLFHGKPGSGSWRRILSEESRREGAGIEVLEEALVRRKRIESTVDRERPATTGRQGETGTAERRVWYDPATPSADPNPE